MKKISGPFLPIIFLLVFLLYVPCLGAANKSSNQVDKQTPHHGFEKAKQMRLSDLPAKARAKISQQLQKAEYDVSSYEKKLPSGKTSSYRAFNRKQNMTAYFTDQAVHLMPNSKGDPAWHLEMTLSGYGYKGTIEPVRPDRSDTIKASGHRIEYQRGALTEWYVNDKRGFEQGVTVKEPPVGEKTGTLWWNGP